MTRLACASLWRWSAALCVVAAIHGCGAAAQQVAPRPKIAGEVTASMGHPTVGDLAPDFELPDQDGKLVKLSSLRGSPVLLHFGASWCPFCAEELPHLEQLAEQYAPKGVRVLLVDVKEAEGPRHEYANRVQLSFPFLWDETGATCSAYAPNGALPSFKNRAQVVVASNIVLDRGGHVRFFTLVDTGHFDAALVSARKALDYVLAHPEAQ